MSKLAKSSSRKSLYIVHDKDPCLDHWQVLNNSHGKGQELQKDVVLTNIFKLAVNSLPLANIRDILIRNFSLRGKRRGLRANHSRWGILLGRLLLSERAENARSSGFDASVTGIFPWPPRATQLLRVASVAGQTPPDVVDHGWCKPLKPIRPPAILVFLRQPAIEIRELVNRRFEYSILSGWNNSVGSNWQDLMSLIVYLCTEDLAWHNIKALSPWTWKIRRSE
jgi:hypothetical protein